MLITMINQYKRCYVPLKQHTGFLTLYLHNYFTIAISFSSLLHAYTLYAYSVRMVLWPNRIASQTDHSLCSSPCISNDTFLIVHQNVVKCNKTHTHSLDSALISCSSVRLSETASERERKASQSKRRKSVGASWKPYYFCQIDWHRHEMIKCFHFYSSKSM